MALADLFPLKPDYFQGGSLVTDQDMEGLRALLNELAAAIPSGGGGGTVEVQEDGVTIVAAADTIDFVGHELSVADIGGGVARITANAIAQGRTAFVAKTGNDSLDGRDDDKPFLTIAAAVTFVNTQSPTATTPWLIKIIDAETYTEDFTLPANTAFLAESARIVGQVTAGTNSIAKISQHETQNNAIAFANTSSGKAVYIVDKLVTNGSSSAGVINESGPTTVVVQGASGAGSFLTVSNAAALTQAQFGHISIEGSTPAIDVSAGQAVVIAQSLAESGAGIGVGVALQISGGALQANLGSLTASTAFNVSGGSAEVYAGRVSATSLYSVTAGSLSLFGYSLSGTESSTGTGIATVYRNTDIGERLLSGQYTFESSIAGPPPSGQILFDNAVQENATQISVHETGSHGKDVSGFLSLLSVGDRVYIQGTDSPAKQYLFEVTGAPVDQGSYWDIPVTNLSFQGAGFINDRAIRASFLLTPDAGQTGYVPTTPAHWSTVPDTVEGALDYLVDRGSNYTFGALRLTSTTTRRWLVPGAQNIVAPTGVFVLPVTKSGLLRRLVVIQNSPVAAGQSITYVAQHGATIAGIADTPITLVRTSDSNVAGIAAGSIAVSVGDVVAIAVDKSAATTSQIRDVYAFLEII